MCLVSVPILITFFTIVSSRSLLGREPKDQSDWREPTKYLPLKMASDHGPILSQLVVVEMHYDCQGRLLHQESSKLKIQTGLFLVPGEEDLLTNLYKNSEISSTASEEESNGISTIYDEQNDSPVMTDPPMFFRSMKKRIRTGTKIQATPTVKHIIVQPKVGAATTLTPPTKDGVKPDQISIDKIIDVPIRSCPPGQNEDPTGNCRQIFP